MEKLFTQLIESWSSVRLANTRGLVLFENKILPLALIEACF